MYLPSAVQNETVRVGQVKQVARAIGRSPVAKDRPESILSFLALRLRAELSTVAQQRFVGSSISAPSQDTARTMDGFSKRVQK